MTWLLFVSTVLAPMRFATKRGGLMHGAVSLGHDVPARFSTSQAMSLSLSFCSQINRRQARKWVRPHDLLLLFGKVPPRNTWCLPAQLARRARLRLRCF